MFVGAINATVRAFLARHAEAFRDAPVVVGCSGNFTSETVLAHYGRPAALHGNDVSLYSVSIGRWLTGQPLAFTRTDPEYAWLDPYLATDQDRLATLMVLPDMLAFEKRNTAHRQRLWDRYAEVFPTLHAKTVERLGKVSLSLTSFFAGDVAAHFERFADDDRAIFCCYAPTYAGGYERMYRRLESIFTWQPPEYGLLDEAARDRLLAWLADRRYVWYDDRKLDGYRPVMQQREGRQRTVYIYSNVIDRPAVFLGWTPAELPKRQLAGADFRITDASTLTVEPITTSDLSRFKDAYLSKAIDHGPGTWAFAVVIDGCTIGFFEFARPTFGRSDGVYLQSDFAVPHTIYKRLSKLILALVIAGDTRRLIERKRELITRTVDTTAFTDKPISMKYRGVFALIKRGKTKDGQKFLNYRGTFNEATWQQTFQAWRTKHGSVTSSTPSTPASGTTPPTS